MGSRIAKKEIIKELIRCGKDPIYFLRKYAKIEHPNKGSLPFKLFDYQEDIVENLLENRNNIILKARQLGVTTIIGGFLAWLMIFHKHQNILVLATQLQKSKITLRVVKNIIRYLPVWMKAAFVKIDINNRTSLELENGSRISAIATSGDAGIGEAVSFLFIDEAAHIENIESMWAQIFPTLSTGGRCCIASTPKGAGNFFHKLWSNARDGVGNFNCRLKPYTNAEDPNETYDDRLMYWVRPGCDGAWLEQETADDKPRDIAQERLCSFLASGDTFIWHEDIERLDAESRAFIKTFNVDRNVWMWEEPDLNGSYLISCDVSRGDAKDYSAFHIIRLDTKPLEQVAEYKGKIKPDQLGELLVAVAQYYSNATIAIENNSGWSGQATLRIQQLNYPNLYYSRKRKSKTKENRMPDPIYAQLRNDYLPGYSVTSANRSAMLSKMEQYVRLGEITINSPRLVDEFKTFIVTDTNRPEAQRGMNDDLVMALAGGLWVRDEAFVYNYRTDEVTKAMLDSMTISDTKASQYTDFNFNGSVYDRGRIEEFVREQNKMRMANGDEIDLNWLISKG